MNKLMLIKLGGSVITDKSKPFTARLSVIKRLGEEIKKGRLCLKDTHLIIAHGSGSFGHTIASKYKTQEGLVNKDSIKGFTLTSETAVDINRIVLKEFIKLGLPVVSFSPMSLSFSKRLFLEPIIKSLELGFIPLVYGDVVFDIVKGFTIHSGETTLDLIAKKLLKRYRNIKVIQCGDTDGVYDENGKTIPVISSKNFEAVYLGITRSKSVDVTGGMIHKVEESLKLAKATKIETIILNGNVKVNLEKAILGEGTISTLIKN